MWPDYTYAAIYGYMGMRRKGTHIALSPESLEILDALATARETDEFPSTSRTALIEKAIRVWVSQVKEKYPEYRDLIESIQRKHAIEAKELAETEGRRKVVPLKKPRRDERTGG